MGFKRYSANARLLCGAATGLALVAAGVPAAAQDNTDEQIAEGEEENAIVVTGIRSAIQTSLDTKRESTSIVEVISAEDLGQLPDLSIADSLARLPGVTAQRVRGRSQQISIRGLGPDFSLALLNGREVVSAGNNRGIEFDQFPSELISQGIVYKTGDARLAAIGIAGAVDLRTVRPLDYGKQAISASATYVLNDSGARNPDFPDDGYRFFGSYIDQNADGTVGWSLGATVQSNPTQFISRELKTNEQSGQISRTADGVIFPADNPRQGAVSREFERTSIAGSLQIEPSDTFGLMFDAFYSDTTDAGVFRGTETPIASWSGAQVDSVTGSGPFADSATYSAVVPILRTDVEGNDTQIFALGANLDAQLNDSLSFILDYGFSTLERNDIDYESYAGTGPARSGAQDTLTFGFPRNGEYTINGLIDYTDPSNVLLTDPGGWGQVGFLREPEINDQLSQLRAELGYEFSGGFLDSIIVGWLFTDREKDFDNNGTFLRAGANFVDGAAPIPTGLIVGQTDTGDLGQNILAYDSSSLLTDGTYLLDPATDDTEWVVNEQVHNIYIQANIDGMLGSIPVLGNIGVRYAFTDQSSTGTISGGLTNTVGTTYEDFLPSANLSFEVGEDLFVRLAAAKTITRSRLDQLAANQNISFNGVGSCVDTDNNQIPDRLDAFNPPGVVCFTLSGGNPLLQPYESVSFDLSVEKYFSRGSAIIVAAFHKDLSDWIIDFSELRDLSREIGIGGFDGDGLVSANPEIATGVFSGPVNFADGTITGIEGTIRVDFADFTTVLDGFGGFFSYTYADAEISDEANGTTDIPGYSDQTWSGDIFYEKNGFRAKLAARYRSGFQSEVQNFDGSLSGSDAQSETIIDAQIGYTFQNETGPLAGLGILIEAFNLGNEPFVTQNDLFDSSGPQGGNGNVIGTFPSRHEIYGRTFNFTIRKNF